MGSLVILGNREKDDENVMIFEIANLTPINAHNKNIFNQ